MYPKGPKCQEEYPHNREFCRNCVEILTTDISFIHEK